MQEFRSLWPRLGLIVDGGVLGDTEESRLGSTVVDLSVTGHFKIVRAGRFVIEIRNFWWEHLCVKRYQSIVLSFTSHLCFHCLNVCVVSVLMIRLWKHYYSLVSKKRRRHNSSFQPVPKLQHFCFCAAYKYSVLMLCGQMVKP